MTAIARDSLKDLSENPHR